MTNPQISRRSLLLGGAGIAGVGLLAACGSNGTPSSSGSGSQSGSSGGSSGSASSSGSGGSAGGGGGGSRTGISYWHINTASFGLPAVKQAVSGFNASQKNATVTAQFHGDNAYTSLLADLQTSIAAGNAPDVAQIGYLYSDYVKENFPYISITDLIKKYGPSDFWDKFPKNTIDLAKTSTGEQIGAPYAVSNTISYYNADMFKAGGLDPDAPLKTWADWRDAAEKYKKKTGQALIYIQVLDDNWTDSAFIMSNGGGLIKCDDGAVKAAFADPAAVEAIQYWRDLIKDGLCLNVPLSQGEQEFLAGKVGAYMTTVGKRASFTKAANFELRAAGWPSFPGHKVKLPAGGNELVVFSKDEAKQKAAWEFVQYLFTPEALTAWVEGTGYLPPTQGDILTEKKYLGGYFKKYPIAQISEDQLPNTVPWVYFPGPNGLQAGSKGLFSQGLEPALGGSKPVKDALSQAAQMVDGLITGQKCTAS